MSRNFQISKWKLLLKKIGDELRKAEVDGIKLICDIPAGVAEKIGADGTKVLQELEHRDIINENHPEALIELLEHLSRKDLIKHVKNYKHPIKEVPKTENTIEKTTDLATNVYPFNSSTTGICLIISNYTFDKKQQKDTKDIKNSKGASNDAILENESEHKIYREGTELDEIALEQTFKWLNFKVKKRPDCTAEQIRKELQSIAEEKHTNYDAFVCCILSHGNKIGPDDVIYGTDWEHVTIMEMRKIFYGAKCIGLLGKPKLFFIQACRGGSTDIGTIKMKIPQESSSSQISVENGNGNNDKAGSSGFETDSHEVAESMAKLTIATAVESKDYDVLSNDSHFLFGYSTTSGYQSYRDTKLGSLYISTLCKVFQEEARFNLLSTMLDGLNPRIKELYLSTKEYPRCKTTFEYSSCTDPLRFHTKTTWAEFNAKETE